MSAGVSLDSVEASGRMTLEPSTVGALQITRAVVDADYRDRAAEIRELEVVGRDVNVTATGTLALNDTDQSNLTLHADSPSLEEIGKIFGAPLAGIAKVDATITGNRSELQASGTLVGSGVTYQDNGALSMTTTFDARVPELSFERAAVDAKTDATFVTVAGQNINQLSATTRYAERSVEFDAVARQPERTLSAVAGWRSIPNTRKSICSGWASTPAASSGSSRPIPRRRSATAATPLPSTTCSSPAAISASPPRARSAVPATRFTSRSPTSIWPASTRCSCASRSCRAA